MTREAIGPRGPVASVIFGAFPDLDRKARSAIVAVPP